MMQLCKTCGAACEMRCKMWCGAIMWPIYDMIWNVALCGMQCETGCNARGGRVMHNVEDMVRLI